MINQRLYPDIALGLGNLPSQSIGMVGCYQGVILQGLLDRGYSFSVAGFNDLMVSRGVYNEKYKTVISLQLILSQMGDIFSKARFEQWNSQNVLNYMADKKYLLAGEVDARGIGGSGQHFVYIQSVESNESGITMTYIGDPWDGLDRQKITTRYGQYGNIKSLRVFEVKESVMADMITVERKDWDRLLKGNQLGDRLIGGISQPGNIADKSENDIDRIIKEVQDTKNAKQECESGRDRAIEEAEQRGYERGIASCPTVPQPPQGSFAKTSYSIERVEGGQKITEVFTKL